MRRALLLVPLVACASILDIDDPTIRPAADAGPDSATPGATLDASLPEATGPVTPDAGGRSVIAAGQDDPIDLIVHEGRVYWTVFARGAAHGRIMTAATDGSDVKTFASAARHPRYLARHGTTLFWGDQERVEPEADTWGGIEARAFDGVATAELVSTPNQSYAVRGIAADDAHVFWVTWNGHLERRSRAGGATHVLTAGEVDPISVVLDGDRVIYTAAGDVGYPGAVIARSKTSGAVGWRIENLPFPWGLALDEQRVYWAERGGRIRSASKATGTDALTLAADRPSPQFVAVDASHVYFTCDTELARVPKVGGAPEVLASGLDRASGVALDDRAVYWTTRGDGRVWRLAK